MQGLKEFISTERKASYINELLKAGFDTIDFGSFVSPKAIPQMRDTAEVLSMLELDADSPNLLAIVANQRGARDAAQFDEIGFLGFPFSISETFQMRNTNATLEESLHRVSDIQAIAIKQGKRVQIYISMGFGNPYGDLWSVDVVEYWVTQLYAMGIRHIALSDTVGVSEPGSITYLFKNLIPRFPDVTFGAHLHTTPDTWEEKIAAAYESGCLRYDGALKGYGGCPMAKDDLTGNMPTEKMISFFDQNNIDHGVDQSKLSDLLSHATTVFPH